MSAFMKRWSYRRVATSTYEVTSLAGRPLGHVWRTRHGWSAETPGGVQVIEDYPGSRDVAASALQRAADEA